MDLKYWAATDVGRKRTHNEDNFLIDQDIRLFVVADGMGGHASGEVASAMAVHTIRAILRRESDLCEQDRRDPGWHMELCTLLEYAVHVACERIYRKGLQEPEKKGMGTTVVCLLIVGDRGYIAYVGDSRIYLLRGGIVYQLTEDHSLMNELIRQGKITAEAFDESPYAQFRHAMTRAVGPQEVVEVDTLDFDMIPGDAFLLCSDGLYEYLDDTDISRMLSLTEVRDIPGRLIDMANTRGGKDNITALIIQVPENADGSDRAAEINFTLDTLKGIPLFAQLNYQQLVRIMNLTRVVPFAAGQVLCTEGEIGEELFVILRGRVELSAAGTALTELGQGSHFGEMALIDATKRSATATALGDGKLLSINREDFFEILRKEAPLAVKLLWSFVQELSERLRDANHQLGEAQRVSVPVAAAVPAPAPGHAPAPESDDDIVDLSDDIQPSESSPELSADTLHQLLTETSPATQEASTPAADPARDGDAPISRAPELGQGLSAATADANDILDVELDAPQGRPSARSSAKQTSRYGPTLRNLGNPTSGRFGAARSDAASLSDAGRDFHERRTRPLDVLGDHSGDRPSEHPDDHPDDTPDNKDSA